MWEKLGVIYHPIGGCFENLSHAANPLPFHLEGDIYRVFYSCRDKNNKSSVAFFDFDLNKKIVIKDDRTPIFKYGHDNTFYSHGVSIGNIYNIGKSMYMLFMGWEVPKNQHWRGNIGRLKLNKTLNLELDSEKPFMALDEIDPISLSYPFVCFHEGNYKMWYGSTITWETENGEMLHVIKYATSPDGNHWEKHNLAIPYKIGKLQAFSRPTVIIDSNGYHMWYSFRSGTGETYRIGYAQSNDGLIWKHNIKKYGLSVSPQGWDSEMVCYPYVFDHRETRFMLYNGNDYGKSGIGLAVLKS
ncbi:glycoside hydrolase family protein [Pedobacter arcticus]|uniref:hypothetical protein n=1 Tax=Pedobacter arcticus TaxID=752140 RepID=UPI00030FF89B|nr:hypothetical protein [Pedobacter arcticus]